MGGGETIVGEALRRNRATIVVGLVIVAILATLMALVGRPQEPQGTALVALVHDGDGTTHELPLDQDATLEVVTSFGRNVIVVEDGAVRMAEADCANGYCLTQHAISSPGEQIICLPHELWVEVVGSTSDGGQMDESAISYDAPDGDVDLQAG